VLGSLAVRHSRDGDVAQMAGSMTFRIETTARGRFTVLILSGRIEADAIAELRRLFELQTDYRDIVLDLKDVSLVGRDVMAFLAHCEADGVKLENCTPYIREWMEREKD
jgi:anti-anti-sigma regulatory factor